MIMAPLNNGFSKYWPIKPLESVTVWLSIDEVTEENVIMYAKFYTNMFTVDFDAKSHVATFHMIANDPNARRVILRFLSANQIVAVQVENKSYDLGAFFENYLQ